MISVIIPLYNKENYIVQTVESVLSQTFQEFEIVIVDDGSTDKSLTRVRQIDDYRINIISQGNQGVSAARNTGVFNAKYEFVAFLDADDFWLPNHLEVISNLINVYGFNVGFYTSNFARKSLQNVIINNRNITEQKEGVISNYFKIVLKKAIVNSSCVCISKKAFINVKGFDSKLRNGEDIDLWVRLARKYKLAYSPVCTSYYNIDTLNNSSKNKKKDGFYSFHFNLRDSTNIYDFIFHLNLKIRFIVKAIIREYK